MQPAARQPLQSPERLHPSLWRGSQLARAGQRCLPTGHAALSTELPGGGWPLGTLIDLLATQPGIGEIRLLQPALRALPPQRRIVLLQPPHAPQIASWVSLGLAPSQLLWLKPERTADALWAAEQVLKSGSCSALLFWQPQIRPESLRRLHLAAQSGDTLFFMFRPAKAAQESSPSPLRLLLEPAGDDLRLHIVKRRGPSHNQAIVVSLAAPAPGSGEPHLPISIEPSDAIVDQRTSDTNQPGRAVPALA